MIMSAFNNVIQLLYTGFVETVVVLFILKAILRKHRILWNDLFYLSNCILLWTSIVFGVTYLWELFMAWYAQVPGEQVAFIWRIKGPYWYSYWIMILAPICIPQLFWIRKFRKSAIASLIVIPFLFIGLVMEQIIRFISYRDFRPAAWTYYPPTVSEYLIPFLTFSAILVAIYFISKNRLIT